MTDRTHLDQMSRVYGEETWSLYALLDKSLEPRGPDAMHDLAAEFLAPGAVILDAGCRDAAHLVRLAQAHDARGVGVDPVQEHIARACCAGRARRADRDRARCDGGTGLSGRPLRSRLEPRCCCGWRGCAASRTR